MRELLLDFRGGGSGSISPSSSLPRGHGCSRSETYRRDTLVASGSFSASQASATRLCARVSQAATTSLGSPLVASAPGSAWAGGITVQVRRRGGYPAVVARIRSFSSRSSTRNIRNVGWALARLGLTASGLGPRWKQNSFPRGRGRRAGRRRRALLPLSPAAWREPELVEVSHGRHESTLAQPTAGHGSRWSRDGHEAGVGELEQLRDRRPVSRGGGHAQVLAGQLGPELRSRDAVRVPGVELAAVADELLPGGPCRRACERAWGGLRRQEADLVALRVLGDPPERVSLDDLGQLVARPHDDGDVETEPIRDRPLALARHVLGGRGAREHDVPALEIGADVVVARVLERFAKVRHRDPVVRSEVDPAQEDEQPSHWLEPTRAASVEACQQPSRPVASSFAEARGVDPSAHLGGRARAGRTPLGEPRVPRSIRAGRDESFYTVEGQRQRIESGEQQAFAILDEGRIAGTVALSNITRGPFQSANLGYWVARDANDRGLATKAVAEVIEFAFGDLGLHRLEAGTRSTTSRQGECWRRTASS